MSEGALPQKGAIWVGRPWVTPGLVALTLEASVLAVAVTYAEVGLLSLGFPILGPSLLLVGLLWLLGVARLELLAVSNLYTLRNSSLEIEKGILRKANFTVSAAGFSDLEVTRSILGRILNVGDVVVETDSHRDLTLMKVRDPMKVSAMIREIMTVPTVRVSAANPAAAVY